MNQEIQSILAKVDHTLLAQSATWNEIKAICDDGMKYGCASVCIPASYVKQAAEYVQGRLPICTVIGFPNGYHTTAVKVFETKDAVANGASEIDMVINIGFLKDKRYEEIEEEIRQVHAACEGRILKVIIETCLLTDEEKDYLQEYLDEVAELPTYTDGEKLAFAMSAMAGEADAQQRLIEIHLADVAEIAKLYAGQGVLLEDLVGEGNLALSFGVTMLGSLEKPQEVEGMLGKMIMDAMEEYIAEHAENSKIDKRVEDKVNKVADKARELAEELQRKVTIEELMEETGMSRKMIEDAVRMSGFKIEDIDNNAKDSL